MKMNRYALLLVLPARSFFRSVPADTVVEEIVPALITRSLLARSSPIAATARQKRSSRIHRALTILTRKSSAVFSVIIDQHLLQGRISASQATPSSSNVSTMRKQMNLTSMEELEKGAESGYFIREFKQNTRNESSPKGNRAGSRLAYVPTGRCQEFYEEHQAGGTA